jgi:uncharacterized protein YjbI with pentapeptide repeats
LHGKEAARRRVVLRRVGMVLLALAALHYAWTWQRLREAERRASIERQFWLLCREESSPAERATAFLMLVAVGHSEWASAKVYGLNFTGTALARADLQNADFGYASFAEASLVEAKLGKSRFHQGDLTRADLTRADLAGAELYRTKLAGANLTGAIARGAIFQAADATGANFQNTDLSDANLLMLNLTDANLTGANLTGANLSAAVLRGANLNLARLSGAQIDDADFTGANWWRARGLTTEQIGALKNKFAPGETADAGLRDDYRAWLGESGASR